MNKPHCGVNKYSHVEKVIIIYPRSVLKQLQWYQKPLYCPEPELLKRDESKSKSKCSDINRTNTLTKQIVSFKLKLNYYFIFYTSEATLLTFSHLAYVRSLTL